MTTPADIKALLQHSAETLTQWKPTLNDERKELAFSFWSRLLENGKAILLLSEAALVNEAMTIHRLSIEHFANMVGLLKGKVSPEELQKQAEADLPKQARYIHEDDIKEPTLTTENRERLQRYRDSTEGNPVKDPGVNAYNLLHACDLGFIYLTYRSYSVSAAHSTILSALREGDPTKAQDVLEHTKDLLTLAMAFVRETST